MCPQLVAKTKYIDTLIKLLLYLLTLPKRLAAADNCCRLRLKALLAK